MPDGIGKTVQVGLSTVLILLGIELPRRISLMPIPVTDSLGETISENMALYTAFSAVSLTNDPELCVAKARLVRPVMMVGY